MEDVPTEKAEYYLKRCYRELSNSTTDNEDPEIVLDAYPAITNDTRLVFSGTVKDNHYVDRLTVNGQEIRPELKHSGSRFTYPTELEPGINTFEFTAHDPSGNRSHREKATVTLDIDPPVISIEEATPEKIRLSILNENDVHLVTEKLENVKSSRQTSVDLFEFVPFDPTSTGVCRICGYSK